MEKKQKRLRRAKRIRCNIKRLGVPQLTIHRTPRHIYAQLITSTGDEAKVVAVASTLDKEVKAAGGVNGNVKSAKVVGEFIAKRAMAAGIKEIAFDRSGFRYHGRIKALAEAARSAGLEF